MLAKETEKQQLRRVKETSSMCHGNHGRKCFKKGMVNNSNVDETSNVPFDFMMWKLQQKSCEWSCVGRARQNGLRGVWNKAKKLRQ